MDVLDRTRCLQNLAHCFNSDNGCVMAMTQEPWEWVALPPPPKWAEWEYQCIRVGQMYPCNFSVSHLFSKMGSFCCCCSFDTFCLLIFCDSSLSPSWGVFWYWKPCSSVLWVSVTFIEVKCSLNWNATVSIKGSNKPYIWLDLLGHTQLIRFQRSPCILWIT